MTDTSHVLWRVQLLMFPRAHEHGRWASVTARRMITLPFVPTAGLRISLGQGANEHTVTIEHVCWMTELDCFEALINRFDEERIELPFSFFHQQGQRLTLCPFDDADDGVGEVPNCRLFYEATPLRDFLTRNNWGVRLEVDR